MSHEELKKLAQEIVDVCKYPVVTTNGARGVPYTRMLKKMKSEGLSTFYFVTKKDTEKIKQIKKNNKGSVYFYDQANWRAVTLFGKYTILQNNVFGIPDIYQVDPHDPFEYLVILFKATEMRVYNHYNVLKDEIES